LDASATSGDLAMYEKGQAAHRLNAGIDATQEIFP
jgi:hypothetical protein